MLQWIIIFYNVDSVKYYYNNNTKLRIFIKFIYYIYYNCLSKRIIKVIWKKHKKYCSKNITKGYLK